MRADVEAAKAWTIRANAEQMADIVPDIRQAQWRWDYAAAKDGDSLYSPDELGRCGLAQAPPSPKRAV